MPLSDTYVSLELRAFATHAGVSAVNLALAFGDPERFAAILTSDELARLKASCTSTAPRKPDPIRALTSV